MNVKSLFAGGGTKFGSKWGDELNKRLVEFVNKGIDDIEDLVADYTLTEAQMQAALTAKQIEYLLNQNERSFPRKDPALKGLDTAQWKVFAYVNLENGKQKRLKNGQFDFKFRFVAINLQRPFRYRFNFTDYDNMYRGKLLLNMPLYAMTDKERRRVTTNDRNLPDGYREITKKVSFTKGVDTRPEKEADTYRRPFGKVGSRINNSKVKTVGNLAAVRLAQEGPRVKAKYAKRIVFWGGNAKRTDNRGKATKGNRMGAQGYVFVISREYNVGGHTRYKRAINDIINSEVNRFMDTLW